MLQTYSPTHAQVINALARIRQEWQSATEGASLLSVDGNVGLILADVVNCLELSTEEQVLVLGSELYREIQDLTNI